MSAYRAAIERKDAQALYDLLDEEARKTLTQKDVAALLKSSHEELLARARQLSKPADTQTVAIVHYTDGEMARLRWEAGRFRIDAAAALPASAQTPAEALAELRRALQRRSYPALIQVLTPQSQQVLEKQIAGLVEGLEQPEALAIDVEGETAEVLLPGGHRVTLRQENGVWKVQDFR